ncbi:Type II secretion system protein GspG [Candidatus Magnetomoraceae bacterium gMMP-15]
MKEVKKNNRFDSQGFTLIELMVVIVILGILAGLIVPRIMDRPEQARKQKARIQIESLETALKLYRLDNRSNQYPSTSEGLEALVNSSQRKGGYLEKGKVPKDPWGNDFTYLNNGNNVIIKATAPDGEVISNEGEGEGSASESAEGQVTW